MGQQWYKNMVKSINKKLAEHSSASVRKDTEDFPLMGQDKRIAQKLDSPTKIDKPAAPAKKPASSITMDWIKQQKQKLQGGS